MILRNEFYKLVPAKEVLEAANIIIELCRWEKNNRSSPLHEINILTNTSPCPAELGVRVNRITRYSLS